MREAAEMAVPTSLVEADPAPPVGVRPFECPECHQLEATPELLGAHIERHREVLPPEVSMRGKPLTYPCPKGCGRNFRPGSLSGCTPKGEINAHVKFCAGQPPLSAAAPAREERKEAVVAVLKCGKCDRKFVHPKRLENHQATCGDGEKPAMARTSAAESMEASATPGSGERPIKDRILDQLELEEDRLTKELGSVKALIATVRDSGGGVSRALRSACGAGRAAA